MSFPTTDDDGYLDGFLAFLAKAEQEQKVRLAQAENMETGKKTDVVNIERPEYERMVEKLKLADELANGLWSVAYGDEREWIKEFIERYEKA